MRLVHGAAGSDGQGGCYPGMTIHWMAGRYPGEGGQLTSYGTSFLAVTLCDGHADVI